jgi:hypothetical protein
MFRQLNSNDWNVAEFTLEGIEVKCWIFGGEDTENDTAWIKLSDGLQESHLIPEVGDDNLINDAEGSFIVRVYDDPTTDVHWFPGLPEPGDPDWNWSDYYGVFGSFGFNNSFFSTGLDTRAGYEGDNEVYEWAFYWGHPGDEHYPEPDTVFLPQGPAPPALDSLDILVVIIDPPKDTLVYIAPNWWIHFWPPIEWPPFKVDCFPSQDAFIASYEDTVEVNYYVRNMGLESDTYSATTSDTKFWWLEPADYDFTLASEDWLILPVRVTVSYDCLTVIRQVIVDTVIMTVQSEGDPGVVQAGSLTVTFEPVGIGESDVVPMGYFLAQNIPNPFRTKTTISYQLPRAGEVTLKVYDAAGRVVRVLADEPQKSGLHVISWDGRSEEGKFVAAGAYFLRIETGDYEATRRMIKLK